MTDQAPADRPGTDAPAAAFRVRKVVRPASDEPDQRQVSRDETDTGWGDGPGTRDDEWYRRERPPHHG